MKAEMVDAVGPIQVSERGLGYAYKPGSAGTLVFAHGFMDGPGSWSPLLSEFALDGWGYLTADQTTLNAADIGDANLLDFYADEITALVHALDLAAIGPIVVVGQSMGGQIAELVARSLQADAAGLVMFCPAPLKGYPLSDEMAAIFQKRAGDRDPGSVYQGRKRLAPEATEAAMETLVSTCLRTPVDVAHQQVRAWTAGHPAGTAPSEVAAPVLLVSSDDTFFSHDYLRDEIGSRFADLTMANIPGAGHWPHTEKPQDAACHLEAFLAKVGG